MEKKVSSTLIIRVLSICHHSESLTCDCVIDYHTGKVNVVVDALSRKSIQTLRALNAHLSLSDDGTVMAELIARPSLLNRVLEAQKRKMRKLLL